jgi:hypothetical protein
MKFVSFLLAISLFLTISVKANAGKTSNSKLDQHTLEVESLNEFLEYMLTGTLEHSHEHQDENDESEHADSHRHTLTTAHSFDVFISSEFLINLLFTTQSWPPNLLATKIWSFSTEILRPPIQVV